METVECEIFYYESPSKVIIVIHKSLGTLLCTSGSLISIICVGPHITTLICDTNARSYKQADTIEKSRLKQNHMHMLK